MLIHIMCGWLLHCSVSDSHGWNAHQKWSLLFSLGSDTSHQAATPYGDPSHSAETLTPCTTPSLMALVLTSGCLSTGMPPLTLPTQDKIPRCRLCLDVNILSAHLSSVASCQQPSHSPSFCLAPIPSSSTTQHSSFPNPCTDDLLGGLHLMDYDLIFQ